MPETVRVRTASSVFVLQAPRAPERQKTAGLVFVKPTGSFIDGRYIRNDQQERPFQVQAKKRQNQGPHSTPQGPVCTPRRQRALTAASATPRQREPPDRAQKLASGPPLPPSLGTAPCELEPAMLNIFRFGSSSSNNRPQQAAALPVAKQHASLRETDANTPTRRALAPVSGNQMKRVASDIPTQQTASAKKVLSAASF
jgi:hypothetical protein